MSPTATGAARCSAFPAERGDAGEFERRGMVDAVGDLLDAGRVKLYCVDSYDARVVVERDDSAGGARAARTARYESWILDQVVPFIRDDCGGPTRSSPRLQHGRLPRRELRAQARRPFPLAICLSGNYDPSTWHGWGEQGEAAYFNNPMDYVANLHGDHLDWLRAQLSLPLVCGQGQWEDTTGALDSTRTPRRPARGEGHSPRARRVGVRRAARLAVVAAPARPPPAPDLLRSDDAPST